MVRARSRENVVMSTRIGSAANAFAEPCVPVGVRASIDT